MMTVTRRAALRGATALVPAVLLGACSVSSSNGTTTVTINTQTAVAYVSGAAALASAFLGIPGVSAAIGAATTAAIEAVIADLTAAVPAISQTANGKLTFTFSTTSVPAFITAVLNDVATVQKDAQAAVAAIGKNVPAQVTQYYNAIVTVANAIVALFSVPSAAPAAVASPMSVKDALALVHISAP